MKRIKLSIFYQMYRNQSFLKAIAMAIYVKSNVKTSSLPKYKTYHLQQLTGLSAITIKKRLRILKEYGLVELQGKNQDVLVFKKLANDCKKRNFGLAGIIFNSVKDIEKSLNAMLIVGIQSRKDFAKRAIRTYHNGKTIAEIKEGKAASKRYCYAETYTEKGLSYNGIAKRLGVSLATAVKAVKYAIKKKFLIKTRHIEQVFVRKIGQFAQNATLFFKNCFSMENNLYLCCANSYNIHPRILHGNN